MSRHFLQEWFAEEQKNVNEAIMASGKHNVHGVPVLILIDKVPGLIYQLQQSVQVGRVHSSHLILGRLLATYLNHGTY